MIVARLRQPAAPCRSRCKERTGEENWIPLFDDQTGAPFFPVLMAELDAIKRVRIAGLMLRRDWGRHDPWPTVPNEDEVDLTSAARSRR
jgi:hypothetical protein